jgi:hypothetical protein
LIGVILVILAYVSDMHQPLETSPSCGRAARRRFAEAAPTSAGGARLRRRFRVKIWIGRARSRFCGRAPALAGPLSVVSRMPRVETRIPRPQWRATQTTGTQCRENVLEKPHASLFRCYK